MQSRLLAPYLLCLALLWPALAHGQATPQSAPTGHCKLTFRLLQADAQGTITNTRSYTTVVEIGGDQSSAAARIRSGDRIPIQTEPGKYEYVDLGTNIDVYRPILRDRQLAMRVSAESSSAVPTSPTDTNHTPVISHTPVIRNTRWDSAVVVTVEKPTIIFTSDNLSDPGKLELEVTATPPELIQR
jgi:hypothetical protein